MPLFVTIDHQQADRCQMALVARKVITETFNDAGRGITIRGAVWSVQANDFQAPTRWVVDIREP